MKKQTSDAGRKVKFSIKAEPNSAVYVAGTFNDWNAKKNRLSYSKKEAAHQCVLLLPVGRHEYKFVINGTWCADPSCATWVPDGLGSINSVITVEA